MKGILFTELLFNMTVRKQKTMTRREPKSLKVINENPDDWVIYDNLTGEIGGTDWFLLFARHKDGEVLNVKPTYKTGEVLYIKEPVAEYQYKYFTGMKSESRVKPAYKYGMPDHQAVTYDEGGARIIPREGLEFQNKMFVGANKARYYIRIISVKCERLFSISDEDCLKEGVEIGFTLNKTGFTYPNYMVKPHMGTRVMRFDFSTPQESFFSLFRFANRIPKSRDIKNVWCFVYEYVLCDKEGKEI